MIQLTFCREIRYIDYDPKKNWDYHFEMSKKGKWDYQFETEGVRFSVLKIAINTKRQKSQFMK